MTDARLPLRAGVSVGVALLAGLYALVILRVVRQVRRG